ncbi:hypothetical protein F2Q69_00060484 [Brassica cretica]|uniref:Uncharacterized protein n=1 Tax=Brassica cretica TaxID=69181 RepID=A0A8S9RFZ1_BRACR|nr:hypothetical protein F2Q69_00060484 [Brassica cretica]
MQKLFQEEYVDTHQFYPYLDIRSRLEPENADVSWIPKEVTKANPDDVEPPSKEKIKELIENGTLKKGVMQSGEVAHAKAVAKSFGRPCSKSKIVHCHCSLTARDVIIPSGLRLLIPDNIQSVPVIKSKQGK